MLGIRLLRTSLMSVLAARALLLYYFSLFPKVSCLLNPSALLGLVAPKELSIFILLERILYNGKVPFLLNPSALLGLVAPKELSIFILLERILYNGKVPFLLNPSALLGLVAGNEATQKDFELNLSAIHL